MRAFRGITYLTKTRNNAYAGVKTEWETKLKVRGRKYRNEK